MNRINFLKNLLGVSLTPTATIAAATTKPSITPEAQRVRQELLAAWKMSEKMSLVTASQMPAEHYGFKYTPDAMTYARQWKHCCDFTVSQLAVRLNIPNPYEKNTQPEKMEKADIQAELKTMYAWVRKTIETTPGLSRKKGTKIVTDSL